MSINTSWTYSELGKEAFNASRPFSFKQHPQVVFVNTGDVLQGEFLHSKISEGLKLPGQAKKALRPDDILLTEIRPSNGRYAYVDFNAENYVVSTKFMVIESYGRIKPRFLYHVLTNQFALKEFQRIAESRSGTFPQITFDSIKRFPVPVPPLSAQETLIEFFDGIDARISLLRDTNSTLEAIAQALFKSWFVDFDPVNAKAEGRLPEGIDEATAALFPDSFEQSDLGNIPKGWQIGSIYDISKVIYGAPFASKLFKTTLPGVPLVRIRDLKDERPEIFTEEVHPKGYLLQPGDVVVGMDGEFRAYIWGGELAWLNQRVCVFQPINYSNNTFVRLTLFPLLASVEASETATTVIHLGKNDIDRFRIILPNPVVLKKFADVTNPLYMQLVTNKQYIQSLSNLRYTLLPRLISGQLRLPDAEEQIEALTA